MTYILVLGYPLIVGLFLLVLDRIDMRRRDERHDHGETVARLTEAHRQEIADLLQRIQAPEVAVSAHAAHAYPPDPPPLDLEDDLALIEERKRSLDSLGLDLEGIS